MKYLTQSLILVTFVAVYLAGPLAVFAGTPQLTVSREGVGDNVRIVVQFADSYSPVTLYRRQSTSLWTVITNFGQTDSNGYFSTVASLGGDGSNNPVEQYVVVNGLQSNIVQTYPFGSSSGNLTFSQSNVNLILGQNQSVGIYGGSYYYPSYYIFSNSNPNVVSASIAGNTLNLYGQNNGNSTITVCQYNSSQCGSVYVTVSGGYGNIWLNQSSLSLAVGQSAQLNIFGNSGNFYIFSNSNTNAASASVQGNILYIRALNVGNATITVCGTANQCTSVYVTVGGGLQYPGGVLGGGVYNNGALIKENGTVFIVYKNTKTGFASLRAFEGLGYRLSNVVAVGDSGLIDSGFVITTSRGAHPWGSWIKSGSTVYFIHELGLIPIPTYDIFLSNGGNSSLVVPANSFDFKLPMLSIMVTNDSRLK